MTLTTPLDRNHDTPRMRMFAGPNGSGKTTVMRYVAEEILGRQLLGVQVNPDEIEATMNDVGSISMGTFGIVTSSQEMLNYLRQSQLLVDQGLISLVDQFQVYDDRIESGGATPNSYVASVMAEFIRMKLMERRVSFSFETVMSHRSKVELLRKAQEAGYRTYLYFVATEDPLINISRVENRVKFGGHAVSRDKIESRYYRCLELLMPAIRYSNRAFIFDNSRKRHDWLAEIIDGKELVPRMSRVPLWFKEYVLDVIPDVTST